jgi:drug/metabolite transporter (DMT)-like permease
MLVLCTVIWGGTFPAVKVALSFTTPWIIVAFRFTVAGLIFAILYRRAAFRVAPVIWLRGAILGFFFFIGFTLQSMGLEHTTTSRSAFITELLVLFTPILYFIFYRRLPSRYTLTGAVLVLAGLYYLTSPDGFIDWNRGDWLTLACAVAFSAYIIGVGAWSNAETRRPLATLQSLTVALLALPMALHKGIYIPPTLDLWLALLYLTLPGTVFVIMLQMRFQPLTTPSRAGVIFALEPVFATFYAFMLALEPFSTRGVLGAVIVTAGVVWSEAGAFVIAAR